MGEQEGMSFNLRHVTLIEKVIWKHDVFILLFHEIWTSESI
jgi:hypothetical protein